MSKKTKEPLKEGEEEPQGEHQVVLEPPLVVRNISTKDITLVFIRRMKATLDKGSKEQGGPMEIEHSYMSLKSFKLV